MIALTLAINHDGRARVCPWCLEDGEKVILRWSDATDPDLRLLKQSLKTDTEIFYSCPECEYHNPPVLADDYNESPEPVEYQLQFKQIDKNVQNAVTGER